MFVVPAGGFQILAGIAIFILGLCIGSFLNVCIYRIPIQKSVVYPPSHCPECNTRLTFRDMIPVLSYIILRGRCRYCGTRISVRYPLVELLTRFCVSDRLLKVWHFCRNTGSSLSVLNTDYCSFHRYQPYDNPKRTGAVRNGRRSTYSHL